MIKDSDIPETEERNIENNTNYWLDSDNIEVVNVTPEVDTKDSIANNSVDQNCTDGADTCGTVKTISYDPNNIYAPTIASNKIKKEINASQHFNKPQIVKSSTDLYIMNAFKISVKYVAKIFIIGAIIGWLLGH